MTRRGDNKILHRTMMRRMTMCANDPKSGVADDLTIMRRRGGGDGSGDETMK